MSILCTHLPNLLLTLTHQANPQMVGKPLVILDEAERITALSPEAASDGVTPGMTPQRAQLKCPEVLFQEVNLPAFTQTQAALLETLTQWGLSTEEAGWGLAYVDLRPVTQQRAEVHKLVVEMGGRLRQALGPSLQPCIGWDSGKFTAKAAAMRTLPGTMKLIDAQRERPFLDPLPITLLPLPPKQLRWLNRLGIRTLGQFGDLPPSQVRTALGKEGITAQQWALGHDDRPVLDTASRRFEAVAIDFPYSTNRLPLVVNAVMVHITPQLMRYAATCRGVRRLALMLHFEHGERSINLTFVEPTAVARKIEAQLTEQLSHLTWPGYLHQMAITDLQVAELPPPEQLGLFDEGALAPSALTTPEPAEWLAGLRQRYGAIRYQGQLQDPTHPVAHHRTTLTPL